jgi:hypothetical protein
MHFRGLVGRSEAFNLGRIISVDEAPMTVSGLPANGFAIRAQTIHSP